MTPFGYTGPMVSARKRIANIIHGLRTSREMKAGAFAKSLGVSSVWIYRLENPDDEDALPSDRLIDKLGRHYGADADELLRLRGEILYSRMPDKERPDRDPRLTAEAKLPEGHLPILGKAAAGKWVEAIIDRRKPTGEQRSAPAPEGVAKHDRAFFAIVDGHSMLPKLEHGDMVLVDPAQPAIKGKVAFVYFDGEVNIKVWGEKDRSTWRLESLNPAFAPIDIPKSRFEELNGRAYRVLRVVKEV